MTRYPQHKIINDPIHGFLSIRHPSILNIIDHPYFQRLRRIKQLGLTHLVYPGAVHTRYQHTLGAVHLMSQAIEELRQKDHDITTDEAEAAALAILLHDIGHGPFSHALEHSIVSGIGHEAVSLRFMEHFANEDKVPMDMALAIFNGTYKKHFLHQLVSGQLDMDRLDYLRRDSFYTGVSEGTIGSDRIIKMLQVADGRLAVESKGIYSVEKFIEARRIMYWQVYLHKTVLSAEYLLIHILQRAKELAMQGMELFATPSFRIFLYQKVDRDAFDRGSKMLDHFAALDDCDIVTSIKVWMKHPDPVLARLSGMMVNRQLLKVRLYESPIPNGMVDTLRKALMRLWNISWDDSHYYVFSGTVSNRAYDDRKEDAINILYKDGTLKPLTESTDTPHIIMLSNPVEKHFLCLPNELKSQLP